jgi:hypothetical protein
VQGFQIGFLEPSGALRIADAFKGLKKVHGFADSGRKMGQKGTISVFLVFFGKNYAL